MDKEALLAELKELRSKLESAEEINIDEVNERISQISTELEQMRTAEAAAVESRAAALEAARAAIESGEAIEIDAAPIARSGNNANEKEIKVMDEYKLYERAYVKQLAEKAGVQIDGGTELTPEERTAFVHTTANTAAVMPKEMQARIWNLVQGSNSFLSDLDVDNIKNVYSIIRHKQIAAGDAAQTNENTANADDEQDVFDNIDVTGVEFRKHFEISRKLAIQSVEGFMAYVERHIAARVGNALDAYAIAQLTDSELGMDDDNKMSEQATEANVRLAFSLLTCDADGYGAAKGIRIYANNATVWNDLAGIRYEDGRPVFIASDRDDDPTVVGRFYGCPVKVDNNIADDKVYIGYPGCVAANMFDGVTLHPYVDDKTLKQGITGYALFDCGLIVPTAFVEWTIEPATTVEP